MALRGNSSLGGNEDDVSQAGKQSSCTIDKAIAPPRATMSIASEVAARRKRGGAEQQDTSTELVQAKRGRRLLAEDWGEKSPVTNNDSWAKTSEHMRERCT
jgi:hypothetical protein